MNNYNYLSKILGVDKSLIELKKNPKLLQDNYILLMKRWPSSNLTRRYLTLIGKSLEQNITEKLQITTSVLLQ